MNREKLYRWLPFLVWFPLVNRQSIRADIIAGLTGAIIVLPQGVAYALIAGLPPQYGLYTAIITPIVAGLFGCSLHLVSGPTAAISVVIFSIISNFAPPGSAEFIRLALTLTLLTGIFQLLLGVVKLGSLVNYISHTVVIGFTAGAAIVIAINQLKHLFGIDVEKSDNAFGGLYQIFNHIDELNVYTLLIGTITIAVSVVIKKLRRKWPHMLLAMIGGSLICFLIDGANLGVRLVGGLPGMLPPLSAPDFSFETIRELIPGAIAIGLLGLIEAVSIARAIAIRSEQLIDGSQEFIGQGASNIVGSFFSSSVGSGSFTRSGVNYEAGAVTPMAVIFAASFLAIILVLIPGITKWLPMSAMAGVILVIAWNLIDVHHIKQIFKASRRETAVFITTFVATLVLHLEVAIYIGVLLSLLFHIQMISNPGIDTLAADHLLTDENDIANLKKMSDMKIIRINGSLFFGSAEYIKSELLKSKDEGIKHLVIICSGINFIDITGGEMLVKTIKTLERKGILVYLVRLKKIPKAFLDNSGYIQDIGLDRIYERFEDFAYAKRSA